MTTCRLLLILRKKRLRFQKHSLVAALIKTSIMKNLLDSFKNLTLLLLNINNVTEAWNTLRGKVEMVLDRVPNRSRTFSFGCTKPGWLSNDLIELMKDRDTALRKASKSRSIQDKKHARAIPNLVNQYIKRARSEYLQEQLDNLKDKSKKFWNVLNDIIDPGKQNHSFKLVNTQGETIFIVYSNWFTDISGKNKICILRDWSNFWWNSPYTSSLYSRQCQRKILI